MSELSKASIAETREDALDAVTHYRRAARWYFPGNRWTTDALAKLARIGTQAEQNQDSDLALFAWRAIRASILASRSIVPHHQQELRQANRRVAKLMATTQPRPPIDRAKSATQLTKEHLTLLEEAERRPHPLGGPLALLGLGVFLMCFSRLLIPSSSMSTAPQTDGATHRPSAKPRILAFVAGSAGGIVLFVLALLWA